MINEPQNNPIYLGLEPNVRPKPSETGIEYVLHDVDRIKEAINKLKST